MTVQELIDDLLEVEDKTNTVFVHMDGDLRPVVDIDNCISYRVDINVQPRD